MPVWTYVELEQCRSRVFPKLSETSLENLYSKVGGVPRYCLEAPTKALAGGADEKEAYKKGLQRLEDAFDGIKDPIKVLRAQVENLDSIKVSGRLLHKVPDSERPYEDSRHRV